MKIQNGTIGTNKRNRGLILMSKLKSNYNFLVMLVRRYEYIHVKLFIGGINRTKKVNKTLHPKK